MDNPPKGNHTKGWSTQSANKKAKHDAPPKTIDDVLAAFTALESKLHSGIAALESKLDSRLTALESKVDSLVQANPEAALRLLNIPFVPCGDEGTAVVQGARATWTYVQTDHHYYAVGSHTALSTTTLRASSAS